MLSAVGAAAKATLIVGLFAVGGTRPLPHASIQVRYDVPVDCPASKPCAPPLPRVVAESKHGHLMVDLRGGSYQVIARSRTGEVCETHSVHLHPSQVKHIKLYCSISATKANSVGNRRFALELPSGAHGARTSRPPWPLAPAS
jgi:hypothetical protein